MHPYSVVVIGGGLSGLFAAIEASKYVDRVAIIEMDSQIGGISQYLHGEYVKRLIYKAEKSGVESYLSDYVFSIQRRNGYFEVKLTNSSINSHRVILATGSKEITRFMLNIPGERPAGIFTSGQAMKFMQWGYSVGKKIVIYGTTDFALLSGKMVEEMGGEILRVVEPESFLKNHYIKSQDEWQIDFFSRIISIKGKYRVEEVYVEHGDGKKEKIPCDTLIIGYGFIPNIRVTKISNVKIDSKTSGPKINTIMETSVKGIFASGSHLYPGKDRVVSEYTGKIAGFYSASVEGIKGNMDDWKSIYPCRGVKFVFPQKYREDYQPEKIFIGVKSNLSMGDDFEIRVNGEKLKRWERVYRNLYLLDTSDISFKDDICVEVI